MADTEDYGWCGAVKETILHVLHDHNFAAAVWMLQGNITMDHSFFEMEMEDWLLLNLKGQLWMGVNGEEATIKFACTTWLIWKQRNGFVFQQNSGQSTDVVKAIESLKTHIWEGPCSSKVQVSVADRELKWQVPELGWIKINTDGVIAKDEVWSAAGNLLRDLHGRWIVGYERYVSGSTLNSKLLAILHGLEITRQCNYEKVIVESDCLVALDIVKDNSDRSSSNTIIQIIKQLAIHFSKVEFKFVRRNGNSVADYHARTCGNANFDLNIIDTPSDSVKKLLLDDHIVNFDLIEF